MMNILHCCGPLSLESPRGPLALGGGHDDAKLIEAERQVERLNGESNALLMIEHPSEIDADGYPAGWQAMRDQVYALDDLVYLTPPATVAGAAVKLRRLLDPHIGVSGHAIEDRDVTCLRQILAVVERAAGGQVS
jgi:hypothetical protein